MQYGYILKITGQTTYNEAQLAPDAAFYSIGTRLESDLRFRKELFFEEFSLYFRAQEGRWSVSCSDNIFLDFGDVRKLATMQLSHGDVFSVKYQASSSEIFRIKFQLDFDNERKDYTRVVDIRDADRVLIGTDYDANLYLAGEYLDRDSLELIRKPDGSFGLHIRRQGYGVCHNGRIADDGEVIRDGDFLSVVYFSFYLRGGFLYTSRTVSVLGLPCRDLEGYEHYPKFNRNTRLKSVINEEPIEVLDPPAKPQKPSGNILMQLFPALAMIALTIVVRGFMGNSSNSSFIIFSVCSMTLGIITSVVSMVTERRNFKKDTAERIVKYNDYINRKREQIAACRADELTRLYGLHISPEEELENISRFSGDIFDKTAEDEDFLQIRLGLGQAEARRQVSIKKQEKFESEDDLASLPEQVAGEFRCIEDAPITLDLKTDSVTGIVGQPEDNYRFVKGLVLDIAARHYYKDVQLFFLIDERDAEKYAGWVRWLPHVTDEGTGIRNIVYDQDSKTAVFERLYVEFGKRLEEKDKSARVHYVIFVLNDWSIKTHPVAQYIPHAQDCGASFLFFEGKKEDLPLWCSKVITLGAGCAGTLIPAGDRDSTAGFSYTPVDDGPLAAASKALSPVYCEEISLENALTRNITLYEMLGILSADDIDLKSNWAQSQIYKTMAAPLGVKTKNETVCLDLHEKAHGPHGLVAGTTGSGKSEILQTYILTMAILYHPYEVGFVVIDFKGGGMVNQFKNLPHLIGAITNIDGKEINRSLMSIKAELEKRQRVFAENNVNSISNYIKLYKAGKADIPLPHLIIVVDEFAELKAEQPEFMKELISAARIGRSLGVHLILATQKPAGQVNEQIWSNSKFKLCLKVQTREDSNEVLKSPLAAEIKEPGRAYLQVGNNEIFELFQSAFSGAPAHGADASAEKEFVISEVDLLGKRRAVFQKKAPKKDNVAATQLDAIVEYVHSYCEQADIRRLPNICLPPLEEVIEYKPGARPAGNALAIPIGIYDDPGRQAQEPASLTISSGNTMVIGSSQFGKTNLLQLILRSLAENYSPREMHIYVLDFGSMALRSFEGLQHVGGVVISSEDERVKNLFRLLSREIAFRKEKFSQMGITSFHSYLEAGYTDLAHIVFMLDNFIAFKELYPDYEDAMLNLCREGTALGINLIATSPQTSGISYRYMSNFSNRVCFFCNSNGEYSSLFDRCRVEPGMVPGRCLIQLDKQIYEAQTYLAFAGEREIDRVEEIQRVIEKANSHFAGMRARMIPSVPKLLDTAYVADNAPAAEPYRPVIGIDYGTVEFQTLDLSRMVTLGISGREKSGKKNLVKLIFDHLRGAAPGSPVRAYVIDDYNRRMAQFEPYGFVEKYTVDVAALDVLLPEIEEELKRRRDTAQKDGIEALAKEPLLLCAIENPAVFDNGMLSKQALEAYKRINSTYRQLKVLFLFTNVPNVSIAYGASDMLKQMKSLHTLFIMDDLANVKLLDFNMQVIRQYKKPIDLGDAYRVSSDGTVMKLRTVKADDEGNEEHING